LSPSSSVLLLAKTIMHSAARSLCDSWAFCWVRFDSNDRDTLQCIRNAIFSQCNFIHRWIFWRWFGLLSKYIRPYIRRRLVWQSDSAVGQYDVKWADMSYVMHFRLFTKIKQLCQVLLGNQHMEKSDFNNFYTVTRNLRILIFTFITV